MSPYAMVLTRQLSAACSRPMFLPLRLHNPSLPLVITRASSLSAIHRGVRHSDRAQYGESRPSQSPSQTPTRGIGRSRRDEFQQSFGARKVDTDMSWRRQQKLRKKLAKKAKEEEEEEDGGRRTRRRRFVDPESDFGKKSLVYQLKYGDLKETAAQLPIKQFVKPRSFREKRRDIKVALENSDSSHQQNLRRPEQRGFQETEPNDAERPRRGRKKEMMNMTVTYTTAASQFLYGKSVVKAALEQGRRQLYHLYIYGGENRKDSKDNTTMIRLANKQGVPITIVPNGEQRIMDKMSMGRPHNGFVLETSPLPQRPIKGLGKLEETPTRLGFHVELDFQTKEEEKINGTDTFVRRATDVTPRPFVLLLNEIMDPGNLGGILRTASYLGVDAVGITTRGSSTLTPVVLKSAAGAVEEITLFTVDDPLRFIESSRKAGWKAYAAVAPPDRKLVRIHGNKFVNTEAIEADSPLNEHPCLLVLGNEGHGLSKPLKVAADYEISVPRFVADSCVDSLNVSVAAGLLCHSFVKGTMVEKDSTKKIEVADEEKPTEEAAPSGEETETPVARTQEPETVF